MRNRLWNMFHIVMILVQTTKILCLRNLSLCDGIISLSSISFPCAEQQTAQNISFNHFFVIKHTDSLSDSSFKRTSLFLIEKTFQSVLGWSFAEKLQSGDLVFEVSSASQTQLVSNCTTIVFLSVSFHVHQTLNRSRVVSSEQELLFCRKEVELL